MVLSADEIKKEADPETGVCESQHTQSDSDQHTQESPSAMETDTTDMKNSPRDTKTPTHDWDSPDSCILRKSPEYFAERAREKSPGEVPPRFETSDRLKTLLEVEDCAHSTSHSISTDSPNNRPQTSEPQNLSSADDSVPAGNENSAPSRRLTNFSIDRILGTDFGPRRHRLYGNEAPRHFPPVSALSLSPSSLLFSPMAGVSSSRFSSSVLSAFSSVSPSSAFVAKQTAKLSSKRYFTPSILTPPPSSPESSSSSSLSPSSSSSSSSSRQRVLTSSPQRDTSSTPRGVAVTSTVTSPQAKCSDSNADSKQLPWPAWVYCTRYSDRPSSGPRYRKPRQSKATDKRPRTAFSTSQLQKLRAEFQDCPYLSESRRISLARELGLSESQVKIWFQNKRAKLKKGCGVRNPLAQLLMEEGLYNHSTIVVNDGNNHHDSNSGNNDNGK